MTRKVVATGESPEASGSETLLRSSGLFLELWHHLRHWALSTSSKCHLFYVLLNESLTLHGQIGYWLNRLRSMIMVIHASKEFFK